MGSGRSEGSGLILHKAGAWVGVVLGIRNDAWDLQEVKDGR